MWWLILKSWRQCLQMQLAVLLCTVFSPQMHNAKGNVIWRKIGSIWHNMTLSRGNGNHISSPSEKRDVCRYEKTGCLHRKQRGMTVHGFLNKNLDKKQRPSFKYQWDFFYKRQHWIDKISVKNKTQQTGALSSLGLLSINPKETLKKHSCKRTVSGRAEMFPMNGSNWSEGGQAVCIAGIPVPLFAAWLASKYILTSVSSTRLFATISTVTAETTAGSDRPDCNPMLPMAGRQCTDCPHDTSTMTHTHKL